MSTFMFWNLNGSGRATRLAAQAALDNHVDVVSVAEPSGTIESLRELLEDITGVAHFPHRGLINQRIFVFSRDTALVGPPVLDTPYLLVLPITFRAAVQIWLAIIHNISLRNDELFDVNEEAAIAARQLWTEEQRKGISNTIVVGDFNLNPFDDGMVKAQGFHSVMAASVAERGARRVKFQDYPMFYNPMWSRLGDGSTGPPGTYFFEKARHRNFYWMTYDQVLIRPSLLSAFKHHNLRVLTTIGGTSLIDEDGLPDRVHASDHLPLLFALDI